MKTVVSVLRTASIALVTLGIVLPSSPACAAGEGCTRIPGHVRDEIKEMEKEAEFARREGLEEVAEELMERARGRLEEEERKLDLVEEVVDEKDLADEADLLLLRRNDKEMQVGQFLEYLVGLNLLNGLYLTGEQMDRILTCLRKKERILKSEEWNKVLKGYLAVKDVLEEYERMNEESEALFFYTEALHMRLMEEMDGSEREEIGALAAEVESCLTEGQKEIIRKYVPCHIPVENPEDPGRVGQAPASRGFVFLLEDARNMPREELEGWFEGPVMEMIAGRVEMLRERPELGIEPDIGAERRRVLKVLYSARMMSPARFELEKGRLAAELDLDPEPPPPEPDKDDVRGRIERNLLDTRLIPLLERRLALAGASGLQASAGKPPAGEFIKEEGLAPETEDDSGIVFFNPVSPSFIRGE